MSLYAGDHDARNVMAERDIYKAQCATQAAQIEALTKALKACRRELFWCREQLDVRGLKSHPHGSVNTALHDADAALSNTGKK